MGEDPVLAGLTPAERSAVLAGARSRSYARGEMIMRDGEPVECLHLVSSGRVSTSLPAADGTEMILNLLGTGSVVGEQAALSDGAGWSTTVAAIERCTTLSLRRGQVHDLLVRHPQINAYLLGSLSSQLHRVSERLLEVANVPTARRVSRRLLALREEFGAEPIVVTQGELGSMTGTSRATVNAILRGLERCGIVRIGHGRLRILDPVALQRRAGLMPC